jgi:glycosyltransferase involved in cell wall biosynthesis
MYETIPFRPYAEPTARQTVADAIDPLPWLYRTRLRARDLANAQSADRVLVNSRFTAAAVRNIYGIEPEVSYHGVDVERFRPTPVAKRHLVLSVGSLTPLKGFDFLIQAMAQYASQNRPALVIASNFQNPPERVYLEGKARELSVDLQLEGNITDDHLVRLYNEAAVVAYAPVREPFGLVPLEAMACATPVVAVAEGGIPETVVDGETGVLVPRDAARFAAALQLLVESRMLARQYGENGRAHVLNHWTWAAAVNALEQQLRRAD